MNKNPKIAAIVTNFEALAENYLSDDRYSQGEF